MPVRAEQWIPAFAGMTKKKIRPAPPITVAPAKAGAYSSAGTPSAGWLPAARHSTRDAASHFPL
jgi:hypothetical protein